MNHKNAETYSLKVNFCIYQHFISVLVSLQCIPFLSAAWSAYSCLYYDMWYLRVKLIHQLLYGMIV